MNLSAGQSVGTASTYDDRDVGRQGLGVHDEEEHFDEAQGGFDDLSGPGGEQ